MKTHVRRSNWTMMLVGGALVATFAVACNDQTGGNDPDPADATWAQAAEGKLSALSPATETAIPGEQGAEAVSGDPGASGGEKVGCVKIQWCNVPSSSVGTRCVVQSGSCLVCATVKECIDDTKYVCGSATATWMIQYNGTDYPMSTMRAYCGL